MNNFESLLFNYIVICGSIIIIYFLVTCIFAVVCVVKSKKNNRVDFKHTFLPIGICLGGTGSLVFLSIIGFAIVFVIWLDANCIKDVNGERILNMNIEIKSEMIGNFSNYEN